MPGIIDNPVINGFLQGIQLKRQKEQQDKENQFRSEEGQRAEKQLAGYLAHLKAEEGHSQGQLDLQKQQAATERAMHELQARKMYGEMVGSGSYTPGQGPVGTIAPNQSFSTTQGTGSDGLPESQLQTNFNPQVTPGTPSKPIQIGDFTFNPDEYNGPAGIRAKQVADISALAPVQAQAAGMQAGAVANAQLPAHAAVIEATGKQTRLTKEQEETAAKTLQTQKDAANMERMNVSVEGRKATAHISGAARIAAAHITAAGGDPAAAANNAMLHAAGLGGAALGNSPKDTATKLILSKAGFVDFPDKKAAELNNIHALDPVVDLMHEFINKVPKDKPGAGGQLLLSHVPTTDLKDFKDRLGSMGGVLARGIDAQSSRVANAEIQRVLGGLAGPGKTLENALKDVDLLEKRIKSRAMDQVMGGVPDKQKLHILITHGYNPDTFNSGVEYKGKLKPKFFKAGDEWTVFNPKTGNYEGIDAGK
jgi:hypothetical protein